MRRAGAVAIRIACFGVTTVLAQSFLWAGSAPVSLKVIVALIGLAAAIRPSATLLVVAALLPFSVVVSTRLLNAWPARFTEAIVLAWLAGWLWTRVWRTPGREPARELLSTSTMTIGMLAAVVVASMATEIGILRYWKDYWEPFARTVALFLARDYLGETVDARPWAPFTGGFTPLWGGITLLAGLALATATRRLCLRDRAFGQRLMLVSVLAAAGAALFSIWSVVHSLMTGGQNPFVVFGLQRFAVHTSKVNSAASYFALWLPVAAGLGWAHYLRRRGSGFDWAAHGALSAAAVLILAGLAFTGSRSGLIAVLFVAVTAAGVRFGVTLLERRWPRRGVLYVAVGLALVVVVGTLLYHRLTAVPLPRQASPAVALRQRVLMTETSWRMLKDHPVFGVGIGQYRWKSTTYMPDELRSEYASFNAHNQVLQITAELGPVGGVLFVVMFAALFWGGWQAFRRSRDAVLCAIIAGVAAFLMTSLSGQPLLAEVVAFPFWMAVGVMYAAEGDGDRAVSPDGTERRSRLRRRVATWFVVVMAVSVPVRIWLGQKEVNFALASYGFSYWQERDGEPAYRVVRDAGTFFTYGIERWIELPIRRDPEAGRSRLEVQVSFDGRRAGELTLTDDEWQTVKFMIPADANRRYRRIDFDVRGPSGVPAQIRVGRPMILRGERR